MRYKHTTYPPRPSVWHQRPCDEPTKMQSFVASVHDPLQRNDPWRSSGTSIFGHAEPQFQRSRGVPTSSPAPQATPFVSVQRPETMTTAFPSPSMPRDDSSHSQQGNSERLQRGQEHMDQGLARVRALQDVMPNASTGYDQSAATNATWHDSRHQPSRVEDRPAETSWLGRLYAGETPGIGDTRSEVPISAQERQLRELQDGLAVRSNFRQRGGRPGSYMRMVHEQQNREQGPEAISSLAQFSHGSMQRPELHPVGPVCTTQSVYGAHECSPIPLARNDDVRTSVFAPASSQSR